jgi:hypothetical protein
MDWYGKEPLKPEYTKKLMKRWQAPPGNAAARYYNLFPELYPNYLPDNHHIVKYDVSLYPTHRDYSKYKSAPEPIKSTHIVEWEDGYGPCNVCVECVAAAKKNHEQTADYYRRLAAWRDNGTPM